MALKPQKNPLLLVGRLQDDLDRGKRGISKRLRGTTLGNKSDRKKLMAARESLVDSQTVLGLWDYCMWNPNDPRCIPFSTLEAPKMLADVNKTVLSAQPDIAKFSELVDVAICGDCSASEVKKVASDIEKIAVTIGKTRVKAI